jgi:hypothetical protein
MWAGDGRVFLANLHWLVWTSAGFNSVALATGTEERWQCPTITCPISPSSGGYVSYPVNVVLEWPENTNRGYIFSEMVISSPSLGTSGFSFYI